MSEAQRTRWDRLWVGYNVATMADSALGRIESGAIATSGDRIAWVGPEAALPGAPEALAQRVQRGHGEWLLPGLIDCHTHIVFGGDRSNEFRLRLHGASYEEIAKGGGGIMSTVRETRRASDADLLEGATKRARALASWGVTTVEVKSGYGLDVETELRMLRVAAQVADKVPVDVSPTLLAAHLVPPEFEDDRAAYIKRIVDEVIPRAVSEGHARSVDAFCEKIALTPVETRRVLEAGSQAGLLGRLHADQLSDSGGGALAAELGARSADHLEYLSDEGVDAMAVAGVVAVLLPGAFYSLKERQTPPVTQLRDRGVPMAVATDANPGSSPITNVGAILNMACVLFGLTPEEALMGITTVAAQVLDLANDRGRLAVGMRADFGIWDVPDTVWLTYWVGTSPLVGVVKDGAPA
ncbi:MAG: imidazolonepropionase [Longimicrobiales bacterium]